MAESPGLASHIQGVHHIGISVPDIAKARAFYIEALGAVEEVAPFSWRPGSAAIDAIIGLKDSAAHQFMCRLGNTHLEVFEYTSPRSPDQEPDKGVNNFGYTHFALQVDDVLAVHDRLVEAGIRIHTPPDMSGITVSADGTKTGYAATYCRDWFGNVFEIMEIHECEDMKRV
jgi:catechol 2,3-dioxygenase-like lactoylglutathione lyase family enzyme